MKPFLIIFLIIGITTPIFSQHTHFNRRDSIRGSITPERAWWDLTYYHLNISVDPTAKKINGSNTVSYKVIDPGQVLQIDLQAPLRIYKAIQDGKTLSIDQEGSAHFINLEKKQVKGAVNNIEIFYGGTPHEAIRPPWDGGITWQKDNNGLPFAASSCQGIGASIWWPCKDHMYDEVDSMLMSITVPENLMDVSNGRFRGVDTHDNGTKTYHWFVNNPINNYGVNINIGDYVHFSEKYAGEKGELDVDYYVLRDNLEKAKAQFTEVPRMLKAFEHWFGPYPFYEDGFKLVEAPYLGMEHQSSITYGNGYQNGYLGRDLSGTGWGLKFDFIIVHEAGHEWFANNITYKDRADMWIHESFTNYSENLFVEYHFGKEAGATYVRGTRRAIRNDRPIIAPYGVNAVGSSDMYYKGGNMLHTLRQVIDNDEKWRNILRGLNKTFYHQTVTSKQIEDYLSQQSGRDLNAFFNQYLRDTRIPVLEYMFENGQLQYRWANVVAGFDMPVKIIISGKSHWIQPTDQWNSKKLRAGKTGLKVDPDFYVSALNILGS
ncbi:M1 family metallopeptidase [Fulvivirgaceae bacterium BMA10]|uniref:M1 family metallopeptidase n=1 Tax=Splendidivirga corallicola TaxID=3051826 RepID=A0ABT8KTR6_9BACT|nr:M1 family metallopeptidase [Fulvivirgaceae bacterium BMA10]